MAAPTPASTLPAPTPSTTLTAPQLARERRLRLISAGPDLWRVVDRAGIVIGHLCRASGDDGRPFRARRFRPSSRGFVDIGDFWSADDAVDALRFSR